jgi:hypothetical protein
MTPVVPPPVAGLPEGVSLVRIGVAGPEDFEIVGGIIYRGPRIGAASGVIVQPAKGWTFRCDIKDMTYFPVKAIDPTTIKSTLTFVVTNSFDQANVHAAIEKLKSLTGFVSEE